MDKQIELLPCPFCGCIKIDIRRMPSQWQHPEYAAQCGECLTINGTSLSAEAAADDWNTRATPNPPAEQVEAVARAIQQWSTNNGYIFVQSEINDLSSAMLKASGAEHIAGLVGALSDISMRAGQLASGDYKACGYLAEQIGVEILHLTKDAIEALPPELRGK